MNQTLPRSAGALALAAFLTAGPAWAAGPSPIPSRAADEIGPRVIDLGGPAPGTRAPTGDTTTHFYVHNPSAVPADQGAYGYGGGYPGLWTGDGFFSRRNPHAFLNRLAIDTARTSATVSIRGPRQTFASGGIASPAISNFSPKAVRGGGVRFRSGGVRVGSIGR
jgi:hypothetical protein